MHEDPHPAVVASSLLEYRVDKLEEAVKRVEKVQEAQGKKIDDIPGFITRKFEEQALKLRSDRRSWINLGLTALSAIAAVAAATAPIWAHK